MRMSSRPGDPGYRNLVRGTRIFVGDREVKDVVVADDEAGMVEVFVRKPDGTFDLLFDPHTQRMEIKTEKVFGQVFIERPHRPLKRA